MANSNKSAEKIITREAILKRIAELEKERDQVAAEANRLLASYRGAIGELKILIGDGQEQQKPAAEGPAAEKKE